jgi:hypothetical protein
MSVEPRFTVDKPMKFRVQGAEAWHTARTRNVSRSGLLFACDLEMEAGATLELALLDEDPAGDVEGTHCYGAVVRCVLPDHANAELQVAVRFLEYEPQDEALIADSATLVSAAQRE